MVRISIIVPVYREGEAINDLIAHLRGLHGDPRREIIVVDGDPERSTLRVVRDPAVVVLGSAKGRGRQMNAGAAVARGAALLFLHADTFLPDGALERVTEVMRDPHHVGGAFGLDFDRDRWRYRFFGDVATLRSRITRVPFGDQAIFLRHAYFHAIGGFPDLPIFEDVALMNRIKKRGDRIRLLDERVRTSARRLEAEGAVFSTVRALLMLTLYHLGVSPRRFARFYGDLYRRGRVESTGRDCV